MHQASENYAKLESLLCATYTLNRDSLDQLFEKIEFRSYAAREVIFAAGKLVRHIYFLLDGYSRAYTLQSDREVSIWFGGPGDVLWSYQSTIESKPGYETMEMVSRGTLAILPVAELHRLYQTNIQIANWGRILVERELIKTERRLIQNTNLTAQEKYTTLVQEYPDWILHIPQKHLASYLGISPETYSLLKSKLR